jgi:hypothetical protein
MIIIIIGLALTSVKLRTVTAAVNDYEENEQISEGIFKSENCRIQYS